MDNTREKLIDVFMHLDRHIENRDEYGICYTSDFAEAVETVVAMLRNQDANGVTVQKWILVKDRLPDHGGVVLCFMKFGDQRILQWDEVSSWWLGYGHGDDWQKTYVTHWQYLPQPPKGE